MRTMSAARSSLRGQALALFALTMLLLTLMVLMTISFGMQAARKTDLANAADATAYAAAVSTARTFNSAAILNRAIIAHYVTMAGIEAQMAYVSDGHNAFNLAATFYRMMDMTGSRVRLVDAFHGLYDPSGRCDTLTWEIRDASYELWHAALFYMSPGPPAAHPGDSVDGYCYYGPCPRRRPFARGDGWNLENLSTLEHRANEELKAAHGAIHDLAKIQRATYRKLRDQVGSGDLANDVASAAKIRRGLQHESGGQAKQELDDATRSSNNGSGYTQRWKGYERGLADAIMGTRPAERLSLQGSPANQDNFTPLFVQLRDFADAAFAAYPGQPFRVSFTKPDVMSDYTWAVQDNTQDNPKRFEEPMGGTDLQPGMGYSYGRSQGGVVTIAYDDACAGRQTRTIRSGIVSSTADPVTGQVYETLPMGVMVRSSGDEAAHVNYSSSHLDGMHWMESNGRGPMGCHGTHAHYAATQVEDEHKLEHSTLPDEILAFVLPSPSGLEGARGAWGQPVVPVFLSRSFPLRGDPWALSFRFGFSSAGQELNLQRGNVVTASAAGVAHYHRREHLGEPPNMLNPFWRATLQPLEIDQRSKRFDPTQETQRAARNMPMMEILGSRVYDDAPQARRAYDQLRNRVRGMQQHPGDDDGVVR